jgi:hypothetical protein
MTTKITTLHELILNEYNEFDGYLVSANKHNSSYKNNKLLLNHQFASTGDRGAVGATGDIGDMGDKGERGNQGSDGINRVGTTGATGDIGDMGDKGERGNQGSDGINRVGTTGATGDIGDMGDKGERGNQGSDGADFIPAYRSLYTSNFQDNAITQSSLGLNSITISKFNNQTVIKSKFDTSLHTTSTTTTTSFSLLPTNIGDTILTIPVSNNYTFIYVYGSIPELYRNQELALYVTYDDTPRYQLNVGFTNTNLSSYSATKIYNASYSTFIADNFIGITNLKIKVASLTTLTTLMISIPINGDISIIQSTHPFVV